MRGHRVLSHTEIETALTCWARWDFAYGGRLAGAALRPRSTLPVLREGRAWGAAVAAYHADDSLLAGFAAHEALRASIAADTLQMQEQGIPPSYSDVFAMESRLAAMLDHYIETSPPLGGKLTRLENYFEIPIPSRTSKRASTLYRFGGFIDGFMTDSGEYDWIVEYKLRGRLVPLKVLQNSTQLRWYAWALGKLRGGQFPVGILMDQRLNDVPLPPRIVQGDKRGTKTVSHAKDQLCTAKAYAAACHELGIEPKTETYDALNARQWQTRTPIMFRHGELEEAGRQLISAAKLIRDLDHGDLYPIRNATTMHCNGCKYVDICPTPTDELYVDMLFERRVPKRLREPQPTTTKD